MMDDIQKAVLETFHSETQEILTELETALLELEESPEDHDLVDRVFRALHTIKGNGAMFGFEGISRFTHNLENVYDLVREGSLKVEKQIIDLTLAARDVILEMIKDPEGEDPVLKIDAEDILRALQTYLPEEGLTEGQEDGENSDRELSRNSLTRTYRIRFVPDPDILLSGTNPLLLLRELSSMGSTTVIPNLNELPELDNLDAEKCLLSWNIILTTAESIDAIRDVFIFVEDRCRLSIDVIDEDGDLEEEDEHLRLGDILIERGDISKKELEEVLGRRAPLGRDLVDMNLVDDEAVESALFEQQVIREARTKRRADDAANSVRVASEKLDNLVDLVGELVTMQARLSRTADELGNTDLSAIAETIELLTSELRDSTFSIRMVPIGSTFSSFRRTLRDLAAEVGREIEIMTQGGETELDKTVIEKLRDPLVHLIRNAVDHGIESPEAREAAGKPRVGTITLSASQAGADVLIKVSDDGSGMDEKAIRNKAISLGLITADSTISKRDLFSLIFEPAFSTAASVTSVSGRGVGMDVVKRHVESLRGSIEVDSRPGMGTDILIRLPLTLAIIEGLQVDLSGDKYIFPLSIVEECVELKARDTASINGRRLSNVRGELIPYINLRDWFSVQGERPPIEQIVITSMNGNRVGFVVDYVVGEHQTVIKSLGKIYRQVEGVSGATILGDGSVALILDAAKLLTVAEGKVDGPDMINKAASDFGQVQN
jgi:two-component system chemotaxis sensor kinase CheA